MIMKRHSYAHKVDANQSDVVAALRRVGAIVEVTSSAGGGFPDLVVGFRGDIYLIEVKDGKNVLTSEQVTFFMKWKGFGRVGVVRSPDEALKFIGAIK